jgi:hypothetical protein
VPTHAPVIVDEEAIAYVEFFFMIVINAHRFKKSHVEILRDVKARAMMYELRLKWVVVVLAAEDGGASG